MYKLDLIKKSLTSGNVRIENLNNIIKSKYITDEKLLSYVEKIIEASKGRNAGSIQETVDELRNFKKSENGSFFSSYLYFTALFFNHEIQKGIIELELAIKIETDDFNKYFLLEALGFFYIENSQNDEAVKIFTEAKNFYEYHQLAIWGICNAYFESGEYTNSLNEIKTVTESDKFKGKTKLNHFVSLETDMIYNTINPKKLSLLKEKVDFFYRDSDWENYNTSLEKYLEIYNEERTAQEYFSMCEDILRKSQQSSSGPTVISKMIETSMLSKDYSLIKLFFESHRNKPHLKKIIDVSSLIINWSENQRLQTNEKQLVEAIIHSEKTTRIKLHKYLYKILSESENLHIDEKLAYLDQLEKIINSEDPTGTKQYQTILEKIKLINHNKHSLLAVEELKRIENEGKLPDLLVEKIKRSEHIIDCFIDSEILEIAYMYAKKNFSERNDVKTVFRSYHQLISIHNRFSNKDHKLKLIKEMQRFLGSDLCQSTIDSDSIQFKTAELYEQAGDYRKAKEVYKQLVNTKDENSRQHAISKCLDLSIKLRLSKKARNYLCKLRELVPNFETTSNYDLTLGRFYDLIADENALNALVKKHEELFLTASSIEILYKSINILLNHSPSFNREKLVERIIYTHATSFQLTSEDFYILYMKCNSLGIENASQLLELAIKTEENNEYKQELHCQLIEDLINKEDYSHAQSEFIKLKESSTLTNTTIVHLEYFEIVIEHNLNEKTFNSIHLDNFLKKHNTISSKMYLRLNFIKMKALSLLDKTNEAILICNEMLEHFEIYEFYSDKIKISVATSLARLNSKIGKYDHAIQILLPWTKPYEGFNSRLEREKIFEELSEIYSQKNDIKKARYYLELAIQEGGKNSVKIFEYDDKLETNIQSYELIDNAIKKDRSEDSKTFNNKEEFTTDNSRSIMNALASSPYRDYSIISKNKKNTLKNKDLIIRASKKFADGLISKGITEILCHYSKTETTIFDILPGDQKHHEPYHKLSLKFSPLGNVNDIQEGQLLNNSLSGLYKNHFNILQNNIKNELKVFCTSWSSQDIYEMKIDNAPFLIPPMWSHYGNLFHGACLILDKVKLVEEIKKSFESKSEINVVGARRVIYQYFQDQNNVTYEVNSSLIEKIKLDDIHGSVLNSEIEEIKNIKNLFFFKPPQWNYEKEFRVILHSKTDGPLIVNVCKSVVLGIIVGKNIKKGYEKILKDICKNNDWYLAKYDPSGKEILEDLI